MSPGTDATAILKEIEAMGCARNRAGMSRYGINVDRAHGVSVTQLRRIAREHGRDHPLAVALWDSGIHEARILATIVAEPKQASAEQVDAWVGDLNSWDLADGFCNNFVRKSALAWERARSWPRDDRTFVRRAGFSLQANLAVHDGKAGDGDFIALLPLIRQYACDDRNFVMKAVNWSLRQIGKRNRRLNAAAVAMAEDLVKDEAKSARWIGRDALRELTSDKVQARLAAKEKRA
ncbi:MAG: DNA alkylation repair protein [Alphaproteobacteria bacterium]|nr:DNA alkylation repair protein [Alphaproteobacteria bacterium]MDP6813360.1 DNA alkylation repair protein [Alphaproteobacteria bacterium]